MMSVRSVAWAMMMGVTDADFGYLLHSRPYQDTSLIGDFFLRQTGRISILFKGVRKAGRQGAKSRILQPFIPLHLNFSGRQDLKTGRNVENIQPGVYLSGRQLYSGLYVNELLTRLLHRHEPQESVFLLYQRCLSQLAVEPLEPILRSFEFGLLDALGYGLEFSVDHAGRAIDPETYYTYQPDEGFAALPNESIVSTSKKRLLAGQTLMALSQGSFDSIEVLRAAKIISRMALAPHLGDRPLKSRDLFAQVMPGEEK